MTNVPVAWAISMAVLGLAEVWGRWATLDEPELYAPVEWLRDHDLTRWVTKGVLAALAGYLFEAYLRTRFVPAVHDGPQALAFELVGVAVSFGLGITIGRAMMERDFHAIRA